MESIKSDSKGYGSRQRSVEWWSKNRSTFAEVYESERIFLTQIIDQVDSVLDVGCAAGGWYSILRELGDRVNYFGIDVSSELVEAAKWRFGEELFSIYNGREIACDDGRFDLALSFGVLHHVSDWIALVEEMARCSSRYVLFDLRVSENNETIFCDPSSFQKIAFDEEWDGETAIHYNVLSFGEVMAALESRMPGHSIKYFGYPCAPTHLAVTPFSKVQMMSFLLEKCS